MPRQFPPELRQRALRLLEEARENHRSEYEAIKSVSSRLGIGPESLRRCAVDVRSTLPIDVVVRIAGGRPRPGRRRPGPGTSTRAGSCVDLDSKFGAPCLYQSACFCLLKVATGRWLTKQAAFQRGGTHGTGLADSACGLTR
jgi:hypothetical protein